MISETNGLAEMPLLEGTTELRLKLHYGIFFVTSLLCIQSAVAQSAIQLKPTPKTVAWGYYDAKAAPVLRVKTGDTVEIQTLLTNSPKRLEEAGVPPEQVE